MFFCAILRLFLRFYSWFCAILTCFRATLLVKHAILLVIWCDFSVFSCDFHPDFAYIGFENYITLLEDDSFMTSFWNTIYFMILVLPLSIIIGLAMAILINSVTKGAKIYRAMFFLPVMASQVAMGIVWEFMLHPTIGLSAHFLSIFGIEYFSLLENNSTALTTTWKKKTSFTLYI